jgi:hypothetical protein
MSSHDITVLGFAIILAGLIGTEVSARTGRAGVPTFAQVVTRVMRTRTGRVGVLVGWAWLGLHFFAKLPETGVTCVHGRSPRPAPLRRASVRAAGPHTPEAYGAYDP